MKISPMRISVATTIDAPAEQVWAAIEPIERHVDWMADAERITFTGERTRGVGTSFDCLTRVGPARIVDRMTVTEWEPPAVMGIAHQGVVSGRGRFLLVPVAGDRTRFTWREELHFPWWMGGAVGAAAAAPVLRSIWRRNLRRLKDLVETMRQ
jgi:uncharacterized protein YndB with AHSA1/START domain